MERQSNIAILLHNAEAPNYLRRDSEEILPQPNAIKAWDICHQKLIINPKDRPIV